MSRRATVGNFQYSRPWLILCEGLDDKVVLHKLIESAARLHNKFDVRYPRIDNSGGRSKFGEWLKQQPDIAPSFRQNVRGVVIISDADACRKDSFAEICTGLRRNGLPVPTAEGDLVQSPDFPATIVVHLVPHDSDGSIDTLCAQSLANKWLLSEVVDDFMALTPAGTWTATRRWKSKLHILLAVTCKSKPDTSLAHHWQEGVEFHTPVSDEVFSDLKAKLLALAEALI